MGSFGYAITTRAAPAAVLGHLADLRNLPAWTPGVEAVAVHDDGSFAVRRRDGVVSRHRVDVRADAVLVTGTHPKVDTHDRWDVREHPDGSAVTYAGTWRLKGAQRLVEPVAQLQARRFARRLAAGLERELDRLA